MHEALPALPVVIGGYQAILSPRQTIEHPGVNFVCVGDGELPMADLIERLRSGGDAQVAGLWERRPDGAVLTHEPVITADLTAMPFPDYSIFEQTGALKGHSMDGGERFTLPVMTGRGCPYRCSYCCNTSMLEMWRGKGS